MKNTTKGLLVLSVILLSGCSGTGVKAPMETAPSAKPAPSLNETQVKQLLVGHTQVGLDKGKNWTNTYNPDGTLSGTYNTDSDTGTYTIKGNQICRQWSKWRKGTSACWTIQKRDKDYYANLQSGDSESYNFTMK